MTSQSNILDNMAVSLIDHDIDLGDERSVILHLNQAGFLSRDINELMDAAIHRARIERAHSSVLRVA